MLDFPHIALTPYNGNLRQPTLLCACTENLRGKVSKLCWMLIESSRSHSKSVGAKITLAHQFFSPSAYHLYV